MLKPRFRVPVLIGLLALSGMTQSLNAQRWANFWDIQRNFWWQLTWRAPDIRDFTLVMAYIPDGYALQQDYEIWGPVNLIYRARPEGFPLVQAEVLNRDTALEIFTGGHYEPHVRDIYVPRDYRNLLLISQPTMQSCIHVIDGQMPGYSASERPIVEKVGRYSNLDHILVEGSAPLPPRSIFGSEPARGWCYYFQQSSLARQRGDWAQVAALWDAVEEQGLRAGDGSEYFVFLEGLVNAGRGQEAQSLYDRSIKDSAALRYSLCSSLKAAPGESSAPVPAREALMRIACPAAGDS